METNSTTRDTFAAQYPIALAALANHMLGHQLPPLHEIHQDGQDIVLRLSGGVGLVDAWIASVDVVEENSEVVDFGKDLGLRSVWKVRLPDTGIRFTIIGYRPVAPLAVSA